jgi:hypothetical protein
MFYFYNNAYNPATEDMKNLIKVLGNANTGKIKRESVNFMKMLVCVISIADVLLKVSGY